MAAREWQIELLRFTFIGLSEESEQRIGSMEDLLGVPAETETHQKQQKVRKEEAAWQQGHLSFMRQPGRIDVIYSALPNDSMALPNAGLFESAGQELVSRLKGLSGVKVGRVACAGVGLHVVCGADAAYASLAELLPFISFESDMRQFDLQINRRTEFKGVQVNRISKWCALSLMVMSFGVGGAAAESATAADAVRVEFDFNSSEIAPIPESVDCYELLCELFRLGLNTLQEGAV